MKKKKDRISDLIAKNRTRIIYIIIILLFIGMFVQVYLFISENMDEEDMVFEFLQWSESCENKNYTEEEREGFCRNCTERGECQWPLDMQVHFEGVERIRNAGGEIHCYSVIDGINYYEKKGRYYGIVNSTLFTWEVLDASKEHTVEFCCGIEGGIFLSSMLGIEKKWPQVCVEKSAGPRCFEW